MKNPEKRPREKDERQKETRKEDRMSREPIAAAENIEAPEPQLEEIKEHFKKRLLEEETLRVRGEEGSKEEIEFIHSSLEKLNRATPEDLESIVASFSIRIESLKNSIKIREEGLEKMEGDERQEELKDIEETRNLMDERRFLERNLLEVLQKRESTKEIAYEGIMKFLQNPEEFDQKYKEEGEEETEISKLSSKFQDDFQHDGIEGIEQVLDAVNRRIEGINKGEDGDISKQASRREHLRDLRNYLTEEFFSRIPELSEEKEKEELEKAREETKKAFKEEKSEVGGEKEA